MPTFRGTSLPLSDLGVKKKNNSTTQHKQVLKMMETQPHTHTHISVCEQEQQLYMYIHEAHQGINQQQKRKEKKRKEKGSQWPGRTAKGFSGLDWISHGRRGA
jgi:hypothetical protein